MVYLDHKAHKNTAEIFWSEAILKLTESFNECSTFNVPNRPSKLTVTVHSIH